MKTLDGVVFIIKKNYSLFLIKKFTNDIKDTIRNNLSEICSGYDLAGSSCELFNYKSTVKEFLKRLEDKSQNIQKGMIGELLVHIILCNFFDDKYKTVSPFFNMEERSIKKGYDIVLSEVDNPYSLWITEVKSGVNNSKIKSSDKKINGLLNLAKRDLNLRLNNENCSLWREAINAAKVSLEDNSSKKKAVISVLGNWGNDAVEGSYSSKDKNVFLSGVLFSDLSDPITEKNLNNKYVKVKKERNPFKQFFILALQKATYSQIIHFLKEEAEYEEQRSDTEKSKNNSF